MCLCMPVYCQSIYLPVSPSLLFAHLLKFLTRSRPTDRMSHLAGRYINRIANRMSAQPDHNYWRERDRENREKQRQRNRDREGDRDRNRDIEKLRRIIIYI